MRARRSPPTTSHTMRLAALVPALELVHEQPELRLGRDAPALDARVLGQVVVRGDERPVLRELERDRPVQRANLPQK